ncbi:MAG: tRNA (adenosine(37)-N6)-dimethylallyltransferase MiaA [Alistipes sp.]
MVVKRLIVIVGPTGVGKTDLSICLAEHYHAPILSTDSRQVYRGMAIGTAQPTEEQLQRVEHHFIASRDITQEFNCGQFETEALTLLDQLYVDHDYVVAVGGSGLYIKALCEGMDDLPAADETLRATLTKRLMTEGVDALATQLQELDPDYFAKVDSQNPARVVRALEVCLQTGHPYSTFRTGTRHKRNFETIKIGVDLPREVIYDRINHRVEAMMMAGLEAEARTLYPHKQLNALQTVGYKELFDWFDGTLTRDEAVELIKRNSRRYAKRQLTWFKRDAEVHWFAPNQAEEMINYINNKK